MTDYVVRRIVPLSPTTTPVTALPPKEISLRFTEVPLVWLLQVTPESVVLRILPAQPKANPMFVVGNQRPALRHRRARLTNSFRRQLFLQWRLTDPPSRNKAAIFCGG